MAANALPAFLRHVPVIDGSISGVSAMPREGDIAKIVGGNFFRVFRTAWGA